MKARGRIIPFMGSTLSGPYSQENISKTTEPKMTVYNIIFTRLFYQPYPSDLIKGILRGFSIWLNFRGVTKPQRNLASVGYTSKSGHPV
jgi:hypothetical protein